MIQSMTAYAKHETKNHLNNDVILEIRSLNQRYLEIDFHLPEQFHSLEPIMRQKIQSCLIRGKIECNLFVKSSEYVRTEELIVNKNLVTQIFHALDYVSIHINNKKFEINLIDVLQWPGVLIKKKHNFCKASKEILEIFDIVLQNLIVSRKKEGKALKKYIKQRLRTINEEIKKLRTHIPEILHRQHERLRSKLATLSIPCEQSRLEKEIVLITQRMDVSEELDRLEVHIKNIFNILKQYKNKAVGRHLDFVIQELNRESNTIAAKSINIDVTNSAIKLKVLIEQIREQIQNIE